jgi:hypothetical protein
MENFRILLLLMLPLNVTAQLSSGGTPLKSASAQNPVEWINLDEVQVDELLLEDEWLALTGKKNQRFAKEIQVLFRPEQAGSWEEYPDGTMIWRLGIRGKGARALGIEFSRYVLEPGIRIFMYDPLRENILGAYTSRNNKQSGSLPVSFLPGDELIIQMEIPPEQDSYGDLQVGSVRWAYLPVFTEKTSSDDSYGASGPCNVDINCSLGDDWQLHKNAVVRLITPEKCTGVLINNTRQDKTAYVFTAAHCVFNHYTLQYQDPIFYFRYESPSCDGPDGTTDFSIAGATLIATGDTSENTYDGDSLDFALLKLSVDPPESYRPYYVGWNRSSAAPQSGTSIHHPMGDVKKIALDYDPAVKTYHNIDYFPELKRFSHWRVLEWDVATTEDGSSGCPLFDQDQLLVGILTGGDAGCESPINDYFTRFDMAWDYYPDPRKQLKYWLDPDNTGVMSLGGLAGWAASVNPIQETGIVHLYPNPAGNFLTVEADLPTGTTTEVSIYHVTGKLIMKRTLVWEARAQLDLSSLQNGFHILRLQQGNKLASKPFMVSR